MTPPPDHILKKFSFEGFEEIENVYHFTAKSRQSQWVDLDMALGSASGFAALHSSEGMNNQAELAKVFTDAQKDKSKAKATLYVFDEIDGPLDPRTKVIFFDRLVQALGGTVIICTHDVFYLGKNPVFDFTDAKMKGAMKYFEECQIF